MNWSFSRYLFALLFIIGVASVVNAQDDTCNVKEFVRPDGLMIRSATFETIHQIDSLEIQCAMFAIDKDYFFVIHIDNPQQILNGKKLQDDLSIQLSDSTVILLSYNSNKSEHSKKTYEGYYKIASKDLGYIEKFSMVRINYLVDANRKYFFVTKNQNLLQKHFACLRNK